MGATSSSSDGSDALEALKIVERCAASFIESQRGEQKTRSDLYERARLLIDQSPVSFEVRSAAFNTVLVVFNACLAFQEAEAERLTLARKAARSAAIRVVVAVVCLFVAIAALALRVQETATVAFVLFVALAVSDFAEWIRDVVVSRVR